MNARIQKAVLLSFIFLIIAACDGGNGGGYDAVSGDEATSAPTTTTSTLTTTTTLQPPTTTTTTTTSTSTTTFTISYQPSYQHIRAQFIVPYCMACHSKEGGDQGNVNLETYENVRDRATFIRQVLNDEHLEYFRTQIPQSVKDSLNRWINMGAPE